jgi:transposase
MVVLAACWVHTAQIYKVGEATCSPLASEALRQISELCCDEQRIRGRALALPRGALAQR